jgi:hypothetical protein
VPRAVGIMRVCDRFQSISQCLQRAGFRPLLCDARRSAVRPNATSTATISNVRFTSIRDILKRLKCAKSGRSRRDGQRPNRRKAVRQPLFVSRSRKILAVAPSANNGGLIALIVFEMAESPQLDDPERNAGSGIYLSITIRHGTSRELATTGTKSFVPAKVGCGAVL